MKMRKCGASGIQRKQLEGMKCVKRVWAITVHLEKGSSDRLQACIERMGQWTSKDLARETMKLREYVV